VLVEREEPSYGRILSDYIHLNPARAGLINKENPRLGSFRWSSFPAFCGKGKLPRWLRAEDVYSWHRLDWRRTSDRRAYAHYLEERAREGWESAGSSQACQEVQTLKELRSGWVLGSEEFRDRMSELAGDIVRGRKRESYSGEEVRRYDETAARKLLTRGLDALGMDLNNIRGQSLQTCRES
jgi:putative transposase